MLLKKRRAKSERFMPAIVIVITCLYLTGCGYTTSALRGERWQKLYVATFMNETYEHGLDQLVTAAVTNEFIFKGGIKIVGKKEEGEVELSGAIKEYTLKPLSYNRENQAEQYRLRLVIDISLTDRSTQKIIWQAQGLSGEWTFLYSGPLRQSEETAKDKAIKYLAREVVQRTLEMW